MPLISIRLLPSPQKTAALIQNLIPRQTSFKTPGVHNVKVVISAQWEYIFCPMIILNWYEDQENTFKFILGDNAYNWSFKKIFSLSLGRK